MISPPRTLCAENVTARRAAPFRAATASAPPPLFAGLAYLASYFPILISFALAGLCLVSLPIHLARDREQGILRRMSTTPVPPAWLLAAEV